MKDWHNKVSFVCCLDVVCVPPCVLRLTYDVQLCTLQPQPAQHVHVTPQNAVDRILGRCFAAVTRPDPKYLVALGWCCWDRCVSCTKRLQQLYVL